MQYACRTMAKDKFSKQISWEELQSMGDPNADPIIPPEQKSNDVKPRKSINDAIRVYIERKGRGGKTVTLIKGLSLATPQLETLCKELKSKCGVGGKVEGRQVMIQGDQRKKVIQALLSKGYSDVKNAGG